MMVNLDVGGYTKTINHLDVGGYTKTINQLIYRLERRECFNINHYI